jgi:hypothetical protein
MEIEDDSISSVGLVECESILKSASSGHSQSNRLEFCGRTINTSICRYLEFQKERIEILSKPSSIPFYFQTLFTFWGTHERPCPTP